MPSPSGRVIWSPAPSRPYIAELSSPGPPGTDPEEDDADVRLPDPAPAARPGRQACLGPPSTSESCVREPLPPGAARADAGLWPPVGSGQATDPVGVTASAQLHRPVLIF